MQNHDFIVQYRPTLLPLMALGLRIPRHGEQILMRVGLLLDDWLNRFGDGPQPPLDRIEMAFWYGLYQLECLAEIPPDRPLVPYELTLFDQLAECCDLIRRELPLPSMYFATRPNGYFDGKVEFDEDELVVDTVAPSVEAV